MEQVPKQIDVSTVGIVHLDGMEASSACDGDGADLALVESVEHQTLDGLVEEIVVLLHDLFEDDVWRADTLEGSKLVSVQLKHHAATRSMCGAWRDIGHHVRGEYARTG
jgi:hypothetical protein